MADKEKTVWGIHAGKTGDADTLFLKKKYVAIGWHKLGDLTPLGHGREALKDKLRQCFPDKKPAAIPVDAGTISRFLNDVQPGDIIVYPSKGTRQIHIGKIDGPYRYEPGLEPGYPNVRPVTWLNSFPRTHFSQGALYEIGSFLSLFQVKNYAEEFLAAVRGELPAAPPEIDETLTVVAENIEETTRDFILKRLAQEFKGYPLQEFVAHLLETMGYRTRVSPEGSDAGVDIVAHKDELGFEPPIIKVQVKSSEGSVGDPAVSALYGKVAAGEFALLVTLGTFTAQARSFAQSKSNLRLIDGEELVELILEHYENLDSRYKGLLPLKKVYVPEAVEKEEE